MVALLAGWLALALKPPPALLLVASALVKYVTAPLIPVAAIDALVRRSRWSLLSLAFVTAAAGLVIGMYGRVAP